MPPAITAAPQLQPGLQLFWDAFWRLDTCRSMGMGESGPIPWTAVQDYADRHELGARLRAELWHHIRAMELEYREWLSETRDRAKRLEAKPEPPPPRPDANPRVVRFGAAGAGKRSARARK